MKAQAKHQGIVAPKVDDSRPLSRRFVDAADELYSAATGHIALGGSGNIPLKDFTRAYERLGAALIEFASASNAWDDHPGKIEARDREQARVDDVVLRRRRRLLRG